MISRMALFIFSFQTPLGVDTFFSILARLLGYVFRVWVCVWHGWVDTSKVIFRRFLTTPVFCACLYLDESWWECVTRGQPYISVSDGFAVVFQVITEIAL